MPKLLLLNSVLCVDYNPSLCLQVFSLIGFVGVDGRIVLTFVLLSTSNRLYQNNLNAGVMDMSQDGTIERSTLIIIFAHCRITTTMALQ